MIYNSYILKWFQFLNFKIIIISSIYYIFLFKIGEAAKLKPSEVELKRLEDLSEAIVQDFARMRKNEEEMRDTNGNRKL